MPTDRDLHNKIYSGTHTYTTSSNMSSSAADLTTAPPAGQHLVVTDILVATDTAMVFSFLEETSGTVIGAVRLIQNSSIFISPRGRWRLPVSAKKLQGQAGASGNVYITVWYYYE
jgi:hypothetical protein